MERKEVILELPLEVYVIDDVEEKIPFDRSSLRTAIIAFLKMKGLNDYHPMGLYPSLPYYIEKISSSMVSYTTIEVFDMLKGTIQSDISEIMGTNSIKVLVPVDYATKITENDHKTRIRGIGSIKNIDGTRKFAIDRIVSIDVILL